MLTEITASPLLIAAATLAALGTILMIAGVAALWRMRPLRFALRTLAGLVLLLAGMLAAALAVGIQGYRALTREEVAAWIFARPAGSHRFEATFRFPDGREASFELPGDEIYVDAHILKWKPLANIMGLHTAYELDRVAGRYRDIEQERSAARSVYPLGRDRLVDLFGLRQRYAFLAPVLDAEYGSATFVPVTQPAEFELRVSTTGLLIRQTASGSK